MISTGGNIPVENTQGLVGPDGLLPEVDIRENGNQERVGEVAGVAGATIAATEVSTVLEREQGEGADRSHEVFRLTRNPETYEVAVDSDLTLEDYKARTDPKDWALLERFAKEVQGRTVTFVNPTMEGGGVAMLRPTLVHMLNQLGVKAHWFVMAGAQRPEEGNPFAFTKLMHNISQRQAGEARITEEGKALHHKWAVEENGPVLTQQEPIRNADIIVVDDPQPAPLIASFREANPNAKFVWRNHIDTHHDLMADPTTPQGEVASYLLDECGVRGVDAVVTHPVEQFVHPGMEDKTYFAPATIDQFDNLNKHLSEEEVAEGIDFINSEIALKNAELMEQGREADVIQQLDTNPNRKRLTLIARFDESKGMDKAMEMGYRTRQELRERGIPEAELPEVVIVGNGSVDDPSGVPMFEKMLKLRREKYADDANGIILMRLKHNYDAMNALTTRTTVLMQTSDAEGLETRVTDGINHDKPTVVSNRGGIKTQVIEGKSGIILDYDKPGHDLQRGVDFMTEMLTDDAKYAAMVESTREAASKHNRREFTTVGNAVRFLRVFGRVLSGQKEADRTWLLRDMVEQEERRTGALGAVAVVQ